MINNVFKYVNLIEIMVMFVVYVYYISLEVIDNGCGFDF